MKSLFPNSTLLWTTDNEGVFIEKCSEVDSASLDGSDYESIVEALKSDFYIDISLFIGTVHSSVEQVQLQYPWEKHCFTISLASSPKKKVFKDLEAIPFVTLAEVSIETKKLIINQVFKEINSDQELIHTIRTYNRY